MVKIYTKTGDAGTTALFSGERVSKADALVDTYGTVDELNTVIGVARSIHSAQDRLDEILAMLQHELFDLGADFASGKPEAARISSTNVVRQEEIIDELEAQLPGLTGFILPGGHPVAAQLHVARTICRRAERLGVAARDEKSIAPVLLKYLNRLADLLFVLARYANLVHGRNDVQWDK